MQDIARAKKGRTNAKWPAQPFLLSFLNGWRRIKSHSRPTGPLSNLSMLFFSISWRSKESKLLERCCRGKKFNDRAQHSFISLLSLSLLSLFYVIYVPSLIRQKKEETFSGNTGKESLQFLFQFDSLSCHELGSHFVICNCPPVPLFPQTQTILKDLIYSSSLPTGQKIFNRVPNCSEKDRREQEERSQSKQEIWLCQLKQIEDDKRTHLRMETERRS